ncbi:MAG: hypothetical protein K0R08_362 [Solimicrobium sp.]|jgi:hypothetical protein|nr:hypothetical protein [Solimicrobium sp.]
MDCFKAMTDKTSNGFATGEQQQLNSVGKSRRCCPAPDARMLKKFTTGTAIFIFGMATVSCLASLLIKTDCSLLNITDANNTECKFIIDTGSNNTESYICNFKPVLIHTLTAGPVAYMVGIMVLAIGYAYYYLDGRKVKFFDIDSEPLSTRNNVSIDNPNSYRTLDGEITRGDSIFMSKDSKESIKSERGILRSGERNFNESTSSVVSENNVLRNRKPGIEIANAANVAKTVEEKHPKLYLEGYVEAYNVKFTETYSERYNTALVTMSKPDAETYARTYATNEATKFAENAAKETVEAFEENAYRYGSGD